MHRMKKFLLSIMFAIILSSSILANANASTSTYISAQTDITEDEYDRRLKEGYEAYYKELRETNKLSKNSITTQNAVIKKLVELVFKDLAKKGVGATAKATTKNVVTKITKHAIEEAVKDGITSIMIDNLLSGKSSGMVAVEKFDDTLGKSRVIVDRNNRTVAILDPVHNTVITIYKDNDKSIENRIKSGRWLKGKWNFK
ncbi:DUF4258 domain-containing protein [Paenibacillus lentus]|uniref:Uncharacterized protein n=1 Tax=Paenibacillus lentus TaxID=1338368 RepID=A0A3Q8S6N9_9BACL|nr:DUF4258 domain-containing protein [Paenibacillus lentus]AZK48462.1 hypothetical protein EIM92_21680 [Paenibacillus lentus]